MTLGIGICGLGTVGSGTFNLVTGNADEITRKIGRDVVIAQVGCRRGHPDCDLSSTTVTRDIFDVARNPEVDVLVELIGGTDPALQLVTEAIESGKHVVTANKALIAQHGDALFALANKYGVSLRFEAAIAGGIPIVKALREGLAGNRIDYVTGIINGTSNFILTEMEGGNRWFADVLEEAQALGYAEADPTFDVEGIDAAHKLTILSSLAFGGPLAFDAIYTEGIGTITPADINYARELGFRIKHLGITRRQESGIELRVHPTMIRRSELLAQVDGVMNAVMVGGDAAGPTMYYGAGAGSGPTSSAVVADIVDLARNAEIADAGFVTRADTTILPITETSAACYLRLQVKDRQGVMASISTVLSDHEISIEKLVQKDPEDDHAAIVIVTDETPESVMDGALDALRQLDSVVDLIRIRVQTFT